MAQQEAAKYKDEDQERPGGWWMTAP
jgi:hypothetical protein